MNPEIYKNTRLENIDNVFIITQKLINEHSEEILNVRSLEYSSPSWTRSTLANGRRQKLVYADSVLCVIHVFEKSDSGKWVREETVVDSRWLTTRKRLRHLRVEEKQESRRRETWPCAGGNEIKKEGNVAVNWRNDVGLISLDRFQETSHVVILTKNQPLTVNIKTKEIMPLSKDGRMFILDMWISVSTSRSRAESCSDIARQR